MDYDTLKKQYSLLFEQSSSEELLTILKMLLEKSHEEDKRLIQDLLDELFEKVQTN